MIVKIVRWLNRLLSHHLIKRTHTQLDDDIFEIVYSYIQSDINIAIIHNQSNMMDKEKNKSLAYIRKISEMNSEIYTVMDSNTIEKDLRIHT